MAIQAEIHKTKFSPIDVYNIPAYEAMKEVIGQKMDFFSKDSL